MQRGFVSSGSNESFRDQAIRNQAKFGSSYGIRRSSTTMMQPEQQAALAKSLTAGRIFGQPKSNIRAQTAPAMDRVLPKPITIITNGNSEVMQLNSPLPGDDALLRPRKQVQVEKLEDRLQKRQRKKDQPRQRGAGAIGVARKKSSQPVAPIPVPDNIKLRGQTNTLSALTGAASIEVDVKDRKLRGAILQLRQSAESQRSFAQSIADMQSNMRTMKREGRKRRARTAKQHKKRVEKILKLNLMVQDSRYPHMQAYDTISASGNVYDQYGRKADCAWDQIPRDTDMGASRWAGCNDFASLLAEARKSMRDLSLSQGDVDESTAASAEGEGEEGDEDEAFDRGPDLSVPAPLMAATAETEQQQQQQQGGGRKAREGPLPHSASAPLLLLSTGMMDLQREPDNTAIGFTLDSPVVGGRGEGAGDASPALALSASTSMSKLMASMSMGTGVGGGSRSVVFDANGRHGSVLMPAGPTRMYKAPPPSGHARPVGESGMLHQKRWEPNPTFGSPNGIEPAPLRGMSREGRLKLQRRCKQQVDDCARSLARRSTKTARLAAQWSQEQKDLSALRRELHTIADYNEDEKEFLTLARGKNSTGLSAKARMDMSQRMQRTVFEKRESKFTGKPRTGRSESSLVFEPTRTL